jgi:hypothetical protein
VCSPWLLLLYLQTLLVSPSSMYAHDYSFCIFELFLYVLFRYTPLITPCVSSN